MYVTSVFVNIILFDFWFLKNIEVGVIHNSEIKLFIEQRVTMAFII